jgi:hypothetical protein
VRIPGPEGDEDAGVQGEDGVEGRGVVQAEVRAVPVDYSGAGGGIGDGGWRRNGDGFGTNRHGSLLEVIDGIFGIPRFLYVDSALMVMRRGEVRR